MDINTLKVSEITITPEMLNLIAEIDQFKGAWQLFGQLTPERLNALRHVATIESVGSSTRIEGAKLSDNEIEKLLSNIKTHSFRSRDEQEIAGYAFVCEEIFTSFASIPFTENSIKQLHRWLLQFSDKDERHRGEYKKFPNNVEAFDVSGRSLGVVFETATAFETPFNMQELVAWTREQLETKSLHPLLCIGIFIVLFLAIHPFQDGNGRLSRILTTLLLLQNGYLYVPYSSLESIIEHNKEKYYLALQRTQRSLKKEHPDYNSWLVFFLRSLKQQKDHLEQKISREKLIGLHVTPLSAQILSLLNEHGRLSISELAHMTTANRNTLKKHLTHMVQSLHIARHGKGRGTWYTLP